MSIMELSSWSSDSGKTRQLHVMMFPWLAHGHISPFVELSKRLAHKGINISFLSTPQNIAKIRPSFADYQNTPGINVQLLELPLPFVKGLPPVIESTADLPTHLMPLLLEAVNGLEKPFERLLHELSPDCVLFDFAQDWAPSVASKLGIPTIFFIIYGAAYFSYDFSPSRGEDKQFRVEDLIIPPPGYPSSAVSLRLSEAFPRINAFYGNDYRQDMRIIDHVLRCYDGQAIAIKSCYELEGKFIEYFEKVTGKQVFSVGPLLPDDLNGHRPGLTYKDLSESDTHWSRWLEKQAPSSVVFASFGSEYFLSKEQIRELTLGLEESQLPFVLVLRVPSYSEEGIHEDQQRQVSASLPEGFESRIQNKGFIISGWAPQKEILSHPSTGAFLTHCGWSSLMEGMGLGLPLIALPMQLDQGLNARLIAEELKVGVEVGRAIDGSFSRDEVCKAVRMVMVEDDGREVRSKAKQMGDLFRTSILPTNGSQSRYIDKFIIHLLSFKKKI
uniref:Glycosyltransferase n=1 Tax=Ginkgo biloba TaxID=3311 RepID=A0A2Z2PDL1_GINBI|nr:UDP-glycosyltransferase [Ginkgo biloba]